MQPLFPIAIHSCLRPCSPRRFTQMDPFEAAHPTPSHRDFEPSESDARPVTSPGGEVKART